MEDQASILKAINSYGSFIATTFEDIMTGNGEVAYLLGIGVGAILVLSAGMPLIAKKFRSAREHDRKIKDEDGK